MSGASWLVDPNRFATKIRCASGAVDPGEIQWKSNPTKSCSKCHYVMDNSDAPHAWPGLPRGVKFDPTDQEIIWHLHAKAGIRDFKPHPFIDEFIPTVEEEDGICYTHPQNLPGVKQDGSVLHFFHRAIKAYSTGTRKRRKIHGDDSGDVRWHKTGRTKPVLLDGVQKGCKKIMVLYISPVRGGKAEKTNWVMHQYHLGTGEDEKDGEYVISKIFYQQQQTKQIERGEEDISEAIHSTITKVDPVTPMSVTPEPRVERRFSNPEALQDSTIPPTIEHHENKMEDVIETPFDQHHNNVENHSDQAADKSMEEDAEENKWWENGSQYLPSSQQLMEGLSLCHEFLQSQSPGRDDDGREQQQTKQIERGEEDISEAIHTMIPKVDPVTPKSVTPEPRAERKFSNHEALQHSTVPPTIEHHENIMEDETEAPFDQHDDDVEDCADQAADKSEVEDSEENKWWENESQYLLSSQQLVEGLSLCDEFLQSQSPGRDESGRKRGHKGKALLSEYARLGPEDLKRDLEECQNMASDPANIDLETPPEFRLSQLEFESQDSYIAWGGESLRGGKAID